MVKSLKLVNFKGFKDVEISFTNNLSVLTGKNNSGKTSILEALLIFQESFNFTLHKIERKTSTLVKNSILNIGEYNFQDMFIIYFQSVRSQDYYELFYRDSKYFEIEISFAENIKIGFNISKGRGGTAYNIKPIVSNNDLQRLNRDFNIRNFFYAIKSSSIYSINQYEPIYSPKMLDKLSSEGNKQAIFRNRLLKIKEKGYLNSLQNYTETLLDFKNFKLKIEFDPNIDIYIKAYFSLDGEQNQDIALLGSGTLQIIEVLITILLTDSFQNKMILLDEPDSHLHRGIQKILLEKLREYGENGYQVLITTHNEQIIAISKLDELLHLYFNTEKIEIKTIYEQLAKGRKFGFSDEKRFIYNSLGISNQSMNFIEAIESDKIILIEGRDNRFIERLEKKRGELFPLNIENRKIIFWSLDGINGLEKKIEKIKNIFELVKNGKNLWSKTVLVIDRDFRLEKELPKFTNLDRYSWNGYTLESIFLENLEYLQSYISTKYRVDDLELFRTFFQEKIEELSNIEKYKSKISKQREQYQLHYDIKYLDEVVNTPNNLYLLAGKNEFQELLNFINQKFSLDIPELETFLLLFIDDLDSNGWNSNWNRVLQQIYGN